MIFAAVYSPIFTNYSLSLNQRNVLNMWIISNWISQIGSTKKYLLLLLRLLYLTFQRMIIWVQGSYLDWFNKEEKNTCFITKIKPKAFSSNVVSSQLLLRLSNLLHGAELLWPSISLPYCTGMKILPMQNRKTYQINRIVK